jgi:hypothetical protein
LAAVQAERTFAPLLVAAVVVAGAPSCGSKRSTSGTATTGQAKKATATCKQVNRIVETIIATGLNGGRKFSGRMWAVSTGAPKAPWAMSTRISGFPGIAIWVTDLTPTTRSQPPASFIQAANNLAWTHSQWGSLGTFPRNYPGGPGFPSLDNAGIAKTATCLR